MGDLVWTNAEPDFHISLYFTVTVFQIVTRNRSFKQKKSKAIAPVTPKCTQRQTSALALCCIIPALTQHRCYTAEQIPQRLHTDLGRCLLFYVKSSCPPVLR